MSIKNSNKRFFGGLAVALLLPLSFWLVTRLLSKDHIYLPSYYVADSVNTVTEDGKTYQDTVFHQVADITLTNQLGQEVSLNKDLKGKILVVNFMFTTCPTICPRLTANMMLLQRAFKKNDTTVHLVSMTVDPERDSFQALRTYADGYKVNHDHWWFLTGDRRSIYNFARNELHVTMQPGDGGMDDFIHSEKLVLLDRERNIRGYYDGLDSAELKRCSDDIVLLSIEKKHKKRR
jgi:protein SCO1/2